MIAPIWESREGVALAEEGAPPTPCPDARSKRHRPGGYGNPWAPAFAGVTGWEEPMGPLFTGVTTEEGAPPTPCPDARRGGFQTRPYDTVPGARSKRHRPRGCGNPWAPAFAGVTGWAEPMGPLFTGVTTEEGAPPTPCPDARRGGFQTRPYDTVPGARSKRHRPRGCGNPWAPAFAGVTGWEEPITSLSTGVTAEEGAPPTPLLPPCAPRRPSRMRIIAALAPPGQNPLAGKIVLQPQRVELVAK